QTENAEGLLSGFDLILDGSDNFPTRYLVNDVCVALGKPLVFGSVFKFEGQVAVFNFRGGPTYRCLYPEPAAAEEMPNCSEIGVLGVLPGIIGLYMANEAIKLICGIGQTLSGKLLVFNALENTTNIFTVNRSDFASKTEALPLPAQVCATAAGAPEISFAELQTWISENKAVYLVDVREPYEFELQNIGGRNIPLAELPEQLSTFPEESTVVFCCQTGQRSKLAVKILTSSQYKGQVVHLKAGIEGMKKLEEV
ncbi:MAG TPA: ThiF family adenylyltransferase, partial [Adhaeribacter sp.]|nr:ThiF family adenylyltransferase [Adhaeribacter sp.]